MYSKRVDEFVTLNFGSEIPARRGLVGIVELFKAPLTFFNWIAQITCSFVFPIHKDSSGHMGNKLLRQLLRNVKNLGAKLPCVNQKYWSPNYYSLKPLIILSQPNPVLKAHDSAWGAFFKL